MKIVHRNIKAIIFLAIYLRNMLIR